MLSDEIRPSRYTILALDGGGIRGVLTARLLQRLEEARPGMLARADFIAGTSSGAMVAVGLACGLTPARIVEVFRKNGPLIFPKSFIGDLLSLWGLATSRYRSGPRFDAIHEIVGDVTLGELRKRLLIASFQLDSANHHSPSNQVPRAWKAKFFHNFPGADSDETHRAVDVVMRSSAAPVFFPMFQGYVDGGLVANNPSMCAVAQVTNPAMLKMSVDSLTLLSIGTGVKPQYFTARTGGWGLGRWAFKLLDLLNDANVGLPDYQCKQLLGDRYERVNPALSEYIAIDDAGKMELLIRIADKFPLDAVLKWIDQEWMKAAEPPPMGDFHDLFPYRESPQPGPA